MAVNWGEVLKVAGPALGSMAQGKTTNRAYENMSAIEQAKLQEQAALNRAQLGVSQGQLDLARQREARDAEAQALRNAFTARMLQNMGDVSVDRSQFRSKVPTIAFAGGSRPSALGADRGELGALLNTRAMQTLSAPPVPQSSQAVPRGGDGTGMPEYVAPEQKGGGFWENALGMAGLGASVGGALLSKPAATAGTVAKVGKGGPLLASGSMPTPTNLPVNPAGSVGPAGLPITGANPSALMSALGGGGGGLPITGADPAALMAGVGGRGVGLGAAPGVADGISGARGLLSNPSVMSQVNKFAGPAALGLGIASNFLPEGKAKTSADWASKGAQIGSFIPGVGTGIGAAGGAIAGAIKGHQNATKPQREDFAKSMGYRTLDQLYKALDAMGPEGQNLKNIGLNVIGKHDTKNNQRWMGQVQYLLGGR